MGKDYQFGHFMPCRLYVKAAANAASIGDIATRGNIQRCILFGVAQRRLGTETKKKRRKESEVI